MLKVVILEDNKTDHENLVKLINKTLKNYKYIIHSFYDIDDKLYNAINDSGIKLYILDVNLPSGSGLDVINEIREVDKLSYIILLTNHPDSFNQAITLRLNIFDYVSKFVQADKRLEKDIKDILSILSKLNISFHKDIITHVERVKNSKKCLIYYINGQRQTSCSLKNFSYPNSHKSCKVNPNQIDFIKNNTIYFKNDTTTNLLSQKYLKELLETFPKLKTY